MNVLEGNSLVERWKSRVGGLSVHPCVCAMLRIQLKVLVMLGKYFGIELYPQPYFSDNTRQTSYFECSEEISLALGLKEWEGGQ